MVPIAEIARLQTAWTLDPAADLALVLGDAYEENGDDVAAAHWRRLAQWFLRLVQSFDALVATTNYQGTTEDFGLTRVDMERKPKTVIVSAETWKWNSDGRPVLEWQPFSIFHKRWTRRRVLWNLADVCVTLLKWTERTETNEPASWRAPKGE